MTGPRRIAERDAGQIHPRAARTDGIDEGQRLRRVDDAGSGVLSSTRRSVAPAARITSPTTSSRAPTDPATIGDMGRMDCQRRRSCCRRPPRAQPQAVDGTAEYGGDDNGGEPGACAHARDSGVEGALDAVGKAPPFGLLQFVKAFTGMAPRTSPASALASATRSPARRATGAAPHGRTGRPESRWRRSPPGSPAWRADWYHQA